MSLIKDHDFLLQSLVNSTDAEVSVTSIKWLYWKCRCNDIWKESVTVRKRYDACPNCQNRKPRMCIAEDCDLYPSFNYPERKWAIYCGTHKLIRMKDVISKKCEEDDCSKRANYNFPENKRPVRCKKHALKGMISLINLCDFPGCTTAASFNYPGKKGKVKCLKHSNSQMINAYRIICKHEDCNITASFNYPGKNNPIYCSGHKLSGMLSIWTRRCFCGIRATYGCDKSNPECCFKHKKSDHIYCNKRHKCEICGEKAYYKFPNETPKRCLCHRLDGMSRRGIICKEDNCFNFASYNYLGEKALYCRTHSLSGMIDVKAKRCGIEGCLNHCNLGFPGQGSNRCSVHASEGMMYHPTYKCLQEGCTNFAIYGRIKAKPEFCEEHKKNDHKLLTNRKCLECGSVDILDINLKCFICCPESFNDRKRHLKEEEVCNILSDSKHSDFISHDKVPTDVKYCKDSYRPDILYNCLTHYLIIEIDENMHRGYDTYCERTRMYNIAQDLGLDTIFIRYNPDKYRDKNNELQNPTMSFRKERLLEMITYCKSQTPKNKEEFLRVVYLYYNGYDHTQSFDLQILNPYEEANNFPQEESENEESSDTDNNADSEDENFTSSSTSSCSHTCN